MDVNAIIGTCHWKGCSKCKHYFSVKGCTKILGPALEVHDGDVYCCDWEPID